MTLAGALLVGCGGSDDPAPEPSAEETSASTTPEPEPEPEPVLWPFTGQEADGDLGKRPVLVAKIDNTSGASPQVGLSKADMVVEELVEGGMTRLATVFHSQIPDAAGPIRSMRASDIGIVPEGGTVVTSGAAHVTLNRIQGAGIPWVTEGDAGVYRESSRYAPYNLFANLKEVGRKARKTEVENLYLPFAAEPELPKGQPAKSIVADFGNHATNWVFERGRYVNTNSFASDGDEFPAETVLSMAVQVVDAGYRDPSGAFVPESRLTGKGKAVLFHGGRAIQATWHKDGLRAPVSLTLRNGEELQVPAGKVWIELVPAETGGVSWSR